MNRVPIIVSNPAYRAEVASDVVKVDPEDLAPLVSGNDPIVTAPASEDGDVAEDIEEDEDKDNMTEDLLKILQDVLDNLEELRFPTPRGTCSQQPPVDPCINVWDTGRAWEREYKLHPDSSRDEISTRFFKQVVDMLWIMQECASLARETW